MQDTTAFVGNHNVSGSGRAPIAQNPICDTFAGPEKEELVAVFSCAYAMYGRFLQLQSSAAIHLEIDEVYVYCGGG